MFKITPSDQFFESLTEESSSRESNPHAYYGERDVYFGEGEVEPLPREIPCKNCISVGETLPFGYRLMYDTSDTIIRMKELGEKRRILVLGVIGSFTPYCWNRHLFQVLNKARYFAERGIDYICCIATNDAYTHTAWASHLGCQNTVFMLADSTTRFTRAIGMDTVIPWLDDRVRSRRYVIYAEDMVVTKMIVAPNDGPNVKWHCEHFLSQEALGETDSDDSDVDDWF